MRGAIRSLGWGRILKIGVTLLILTALIFSFSKVNTAAAKTTYVINDEDDVTVIKSDLTSTAEVLSSAGIEVNSSDKIVESVVDNSTKNVEILRTRNVRLTDDDGSNYYKTYCETVGEFLAERKIDTADIDNMSADVNDEIEDGMDLVIDYVDEDESDATPPSASLAYAHTAGKVPLASENNILITPDGERITYKKTISVKVTAYTTERQSNKITATGTVARVGAVAIDPKVIPYGTRMYIMNDDGDWCYGYATAEDCGGSGMKGNRVDLFYDTYDECIQFGVRYGTVYILD